MGASPSSRNSAVLLRPAARGRRARTSSSILNSSERMTPTLQGRPKKSSPMPTRSKWYGKTQASTVFFEHRMCVNFERAPRLLELRFKCSPRRIDDIIAVYQPTREGRLRVSGTSFSATDADVQTLRLGPRDRITGVSGVWSVSPGGNTSLACLKLKLNGSQTNCRFFGRMFDEGPVPDGYRAFAIPVPAECMMVGFFGGRHRHVDVHSNVFLGPVHTLGAYIVSSGPYLAAQDHYFNLDDPFELPVPRPMLQIRANNNVMRPEDAGTVASSVPASYLL